MNDTGPTVPATAPAPIRAEFTYEFEDFAEANKAWAAPATSRSKAGVFGKLNRGLFGWVLFIGLTVMLFLLLQNRSSAPGARPPVPAPVANNNLLNILLPVIPWLLIFAFIWFFVFRQIRAGRILVETGEKPESSLFEPGAPPPPPRPTGPQPDAEARSPVVWLLVLLPLTIVAYAAFSYIRPRLDPTRPAASGDLLDHVSSVLPWLAVVFVIWLFLSRPSAGGGGMRATWDKLHALHRPRVLEADEERFVLADSVDRFEHRWEAFTHVRESAGLFLLFTAPHMFYFVPKRAFPDAHELDAFRERLRRTIAQRPAPAFPVLPAAAAFPVLPAAPPPLPQAGPAQPPPAG